MTAFILPVYEGAVYITQNDLWSEDKDKDKDLTSEDKDKDLEVWGQGLVNWSLGILQDKDFSQGQQHWVKRVCFKFSVVSVSASHTQFSYLFIG